MTYNDYTSTLHQLQDVSKRPLVPSKIKETVNILVNFLQEVTPVIFEKNTIMYKFLPILKIIKIGRISYMFINSLIKIWK
jgi:hypothetical protein